MKIIEVSNNRKSEFIDQISFLIVTATDIETSEVLKNMDVLPNQDGVIELTNLNQTYYVGILGTYKIVLIQSAMGSIGRDSSLITTTRAIEYWNPKAIIMVGIAFGINSKKQKIGDVVISSHIIPYENARINNDKSIFYRSELPPASTLLINRVKNLREWNYPLTENRNAKVYLGPILTGEKLIDNSEFITNLVTIFPNAIGGEMESAGVYVAANEKRLDWLIIKGICDFADGTKSVGKKKKQSIAIGSSVNYLKFLFEKRFIFKDLGIKSFNEEQYSRPIISRGTDFDIVLGFLESILDKEPDQTINQTVKIAAREIVQSRIDGKLETEAVNLNILIPHEILQRFEDRVSKCWERYNEVLASPGGYLPSEVDDASEALIACICRELRRLKLINGDIPEGKLLDYWNQYKC